MMTRAISRRLLAIGSFLALMLLPAYAQQVRGTPGSPSAVEFPDSRVLPVPTPPFSGTIMRNAIDSTSAWPRRSCRRKARRTSS